MAPKPYHSTYRLSDYDDRISEMTKWWDSYPAKKFNILAKSNEGLSNYLTDVFQRPRQLARSISCENLRPYREADVSEKSRIQRVPSYSCLSPSHALSISDRTITRYIPSIRPTKLESDSDWHRKTLVPWKTRKSMAYSEPISYVLLDRQLVRKPVSRDSFLTGSAHYLANYYARRLSMSDLEARLSYSPYDHGGYHRFNRFLMGGPGTFVSTPMRLPRYQDSWASYRLHRVRGSYNYDHVRF